MTATTLIRDDQSLTGAKSRSGYSIPVHDDGFGPLWIHRHSIGISGIVRAQTWEDAYSICEDEFFPEADETIEEIRAEYNKKRETVKIIRRKGYAGEVVALLEHYPLDEKGFEFVRWETRETPAEEGEELWPENALFQEAFGFRPNGPNSRDTLKHGIYSKDLNGDRLEPLTAELLAELELTLEIQDNE